MEAWARSCGGTKLAPHMEEKTWGGQTYIEEKGCVKGIKSAKVLGRSAVVKKSGGGRWGGTGGCC
jgi:hypothetical protein